MNCAENYDGFVITVFFQKSEMINPEDSNYPRQGRYTWGHEYAYSHTQSRLDHPGVRKPTRICPNFELK